MTPIGKMSGEDPEDTALLEEMFREAEAYIQQFHWCPKIVERYFGMGIGGIVAVFLFKFDRKIGGTDDRLWVVTGDVPSAYFVLDDAPDARAALEVYCSLMSDWAGAVLKEASVEDVYPVAAEPTREHAKMLRARIRFIRQRIIGGNAWPR